MPSVSVNLVVEDALSEAILRKLLASVRREFQIATVFGHKGNTYIRQRLSSFNLAARQRPFIVLTDLDRGTCAPSLINSWLPHDRHPNLIFRVAVREAEAWLLANGQALSSYLQISGTNIPANAESVDNPKELIVSLARNSKARIIRQGMVPMPNSRAKVGPDYNGLLVRFVLSNWDVHAAAKKSVSLAKALRRLEVFHPVSRS